MWKQQVRKSAAMSAPEAKKSNNRERNKNRSEFDNLGKFKY